MKSWSQSDAIQGKHKTSAGQDVLLDRNSCNTYFAEASALYTHISKTEKSRTPTLIYICTKLYSGNTLSVPHTVS